MKTERGPREVDLAGSKPGYEEMGAALREKLGR